MKVDISAVALLLVFSFVSGSAQDNSEGKLNLSIGMGGGRLTIDDEFVAELKPFAKYESMVKRGRHTLRLEMEGYLPVEEVMVVRPGISNERALDQHAVAPKIQVSVPQGVLVPTGQRASAPSVTSFVLTAGESFNFDTRSKATSNADVMWIVSGESRHLVAQWNAKLTILGKAFFENVTLELLKGQPFSLPSLSAGNGPNNLSTGTVIGVLTNSGSYVGARVDAIGPALTMTVVTFR